MARYKSSNNRIANASNNRNNVARDTPTSPARRGRPRRGRPAKSLQTERRRKPEDEVRRDAEIIRQRYKHTFEEDRFFVVEKILGKRANFEGKMEYLVRWQNYPPQWDSWEPFDELKNNCLDMINEFNGILDPNRSTREDLTHCICRKPYKFDNGGMIQCFECNTWFHFKCLNINMEQANAFARYYCKWCSDNKPTLKSWIKQDRQYLFQQEQDNEKPELE